MDLQGRLEQDVQQLVNELYGKIDNAKALEGYTDPDVWLFDNFTSEQKTESFTFAVHVVWDLVELDWQDEGVS